MEEKIKARCPRCGMVIEWEGNAHRPFCSERCKLIDLGRWIDEEYRVLGEDSPLSTEEQGDVIREE